MIAQKCPVCEGRGFVPDGFYRSTSETMVSTSITEECRSCKGRGYILIFEYTVFISSVWEIGNDPWEPQTVWDGQNDYTPVRDERF